MTGTRAAALAQELRERIALADTGPGGALESEAVLGSRYGVSRVTVRRALEELRAQGLVESRRGAGWFVTAASFHQTLALGTFRHAESAVSQAGKSATRRVVDFGYRAAPAAIAASLGLDGDGEALYARSVRSVDGVPLDLAHEWVPGGAGGVGQPGRRGRRRHLGHPAAPGPPDRRRAPVDDRRADHGRRRRAAGRAGRHSPAAGPPARAGPVRRPARAVRPPLPGAPVQPRGRVPRLVQRRHRRATRPAQHTPTTARTVTEERQTAP